MSEQQQKAVITVTGLDKKGIIARITGMLAEHNVNVLDISQTILGEYFNMIMLVNITDCDIALQELVDECNAIGKDMELDVRCQHENIFRFMHQV
ncbi:MAG: ACT domain-containing protein [Peptococcaceae bacterium]|nr:ACT domain-containing protein [Peptococcaceae bacterium]